MYKVGIVLLNFNSSKLLRLTLDSLVRAVNDVLWEVCLVDNGSSLPDRQRAQAHFEEIILAGGHKGVFIAQEKNKGFAGGNNIGIRHFLKDSQITHFCLLNSDVIVTHHWLDMLVSDGMNVAGPVTNEAENEQAVGVDMIPQRDESAFDEVEDYARERRHVYAGFRMRTDLVTFFCTVFSRRVVEKVGLLDERFFPGSFEDDDYCLRIANAGYVLWIVRDCYIHHWGSGSFTSLPDISRDSIAQENRLRFEGKWNTKWHSRHWKMIESCLLDAQYLSERGEDSVWARNMLTAGMKWIGFAHDRAVGEARQYRNERDVLQAEVNRERSLGELARLVASKVIRRLSPSYWRVRRAKRKERLKGVLTVQAQALEHIRKSARRPVCVFATMFTEENITDGYVQRVKAVDDEVLDSYLKLYVQVSAPDLSPAIQVIDEKHLVLWLDLKDSDQGKVMRRLVKACGLAYVHSVLYVMEDTTPSKLRAQILGDKGTRVIWDVHGAVPEEFALYGHYYGTQIANDSESFMAQHADVAITVNLAMREHLKEKYGELLKAQVNVMPIFNAELLETVDCADKKILKRGEPPRAVYAGGLQKWQNIDKMQDLISRAGDVCRYAIFVPRPDEFQISWGRRPLPSDMQVERKLPQEVMEEYKSCHYGFVLRDDIVVNQVACPTKLIEYIQFGILPVMDTPNIGDFVELGMEYIPASAFEDRDLPEEDERRRMAENNNRVLKKLADMYISGKKCVIESLPDNASWEGSNV